MKGPDSFCPIIKRRDKEMKRKLVTVLMIASLGMMTVAGCSKKDKSSAEAAEAVAEPATEVAISTEEPIVPEPEPVYEEPVYEEPEVTVPEETVDEYGMTSIDELKMYATEAVRMRREPNTDAEIAGKLAAGDEVTAIAKSSDWHRVVNKNGDTVYVKSEYLTETKPEAKTEETTDANTDNNAAATTNDTSAADAAAAQQTAAAADAAAQQKAAEEAAAKQAADQQAAAEEAAKQLAEQQAAAQQLAEQQVAAAAASAGATYNLNGLIVNAAEYKDLLDTWRYATVNGTDEEAKEWVLHHPAADLEAVLKAHGLR